MFLLHVVICLKISTFVVSTTTPSTDTSLGIVLWFAWKYLPLWYQQQPHQEVLQTWFCCDLLENIYLCGINNNAYTSPNCSGCVVICLKISTFVVSTTTIQSRHNQGLTVVICLKISTFVVSTTTHISRASSYCGCDLLENIYLCGINNNLLKLRTYGVVLWFAWKYLPLWYQQQHITFATKTIRRCDLLENIYLCGINNN